MGAYLNKPNREKDSVDFDGELFTYGASSMQGWRVTQEDAHNCCEDFDKKTALFAVYDGHGGAEVAQYTAMNFPGFIKNLSGYKEGKMSQALEDAFLQFDATLTEEDIIHQLKEIAGVDEEEVDEEEERKEVASLFEEADMPIEKLLERYQGGGGPHKKLRDLRKKDHIPSPALRGKLDEKKNLKDNNADIKENLDEKLVNGEVDCNGDSGAKEVLIQKEDKNGNSKKDDKNSENKIEVSKDNSADNCEVDKVQIKNEENIKSSAAKNDSEDKIGDSNEVKMEVIEDKKDSASNGESAAVSTSDNKGNISQGNDAKTTTLPDSTEADSSSTGPAGKQSKKKSPDTSGEAEVTSSSQRSRSKGQGPASSVGGLGSSIVSGSAGSGTGSSSAEAADSSSKVEACSSTGRKRSGRKGVIPEEGEDESSFDEEEETTDEDSEDEEDLVEEDSEDDFEGCDDFGEGEEEEDDDEEETGPGIMYGGEEPGADSGCTAVLAILKGNELFVANAGDSRCVVCRDGKAIDMSFDHKPEDELELNRILKAGGQVTPEGRVNGGLNLSRAIGDHAYKRNPDLPLKDQMITALPDVKTLKLEEKDEFMVLACDGIWNSLSSQDTVNFVGDRIKGGVTKMSTICEELFEFCLAPNTTGDGTGCDNMTCIIVRFTDKLKQFTNQSEGGAVKRPASSSEENPETDSNKKVKEGD